MKTGKFAALLLAIAVGTGVQATPPGSAAAMVDGEYAIAASNQQMQIPPNLKGTQVLQEMKLVENATFAFPEQGMASRVRTQLPSGISGVNELAGQYVMTAQTLVSSAGNTGSSVWIEALGNDSIILHNFWTATIDVKAKVDLSANTVTIAPQFLYTHATYGEVWLAVCTSAGKPDYNTNITGTINADGSLSLETWWGVFVKAGANKDNFFFVGYDTNIQKSNGTMTTKDEDGEVETYNVVISQTQRNTLQILNFGNYGQTITIDLARNNSGSFTSQSVRAYPQNGDFMTYSYTTYTNNNGSISLGGLNATVTLDTLATSTTRKLTVNKWLALSRGTSSLILGAWPETTINSDIDITFPSLSVSSFKGSGTEADPYQLSTLDDMILLSDKVAEGAEAEQVGNYIKAYKDKHFKVMQNIDMSGYRFTPIGNDFYHFFAGHLDGNNKTISNLEVSLASTGYAGLFGRTDTVTVIKDLNMVKPNVEAAGTFVGSLVGYSLGTLENITVTDATVINYGAATGALAGSLYIGKNLHVRNSGVIGMSGWTGGVCGETYISIENSDAVDTKAIGAPSSGYSLGGVSGSIYGTGKNLYFLGTVDGATLKNNGSSSAIGVQSGGVCGYLTGSLSNSFAVGTVSGYASYAETGGVIGRVQGATVTNCYFRGRVFTTFSRMTGGLTGRVVNKTNNGSACSSTFQNLYVAAPVRGEDYQYNTETGAIETLGQIDEGGLASATNIYYDKQMYFHNSARFTALTTAEMTSASGLTGFPTSVWTFTEGQYPRLKMYENTEAALMGASSIMLNKTASLTKINENVRLRPMGNTQFYLYKNGSLSKQGHFASIEGDSLKIGTEFGTDTLFFVNGKTNFYYEIRIAPIPFEGEGTAENPYLIKSKEDLIALSIATTEKRQYFPQTYFRQTNDIDLELDTAFIGICTDSELASNKFAGIYDGGGYTIHHMLVQGLVWKIEPSAANNWMGTPATGTGNSEAYKGFIGRLDADGVLRNLNFAADCDAVNKVWASTGVAVGTNNGLVENVRNYADIKGVSCWIGGIVGMNEKTGTIRNCYNAGNVTSGYNTVGGIAGKNDGVIENCANAGDVAVYKVATFGSDNMRNTAGGIAPTMSGGSVKNVLNVGRVYAASNAAGGIIGSLTKATGTDKVRFNDVISALNYGIVATGNLATIGSIGGLATTANGVSSEGTIQAAYYDRQIVPYGPVANKSKAGCTGLNTSVLTSGEAIEGLDAEYWQFDKGQYPVLKLFANEPKLQEARKVILTLPDGVDVLNVSKDGTLSSGTTWSLGQSTYFSISGSTLKSGAVPQEVLTDTLKGVNGTYTKEIPLMRVPDVPLTGEGTEASPYLITSATDWNNLAEYIDKVHNKFDGKYLKITADITFSDNFKPLFLGDVDSFEGTLDGDNHTIKGISFTTTARYQAAIRTVGAGGVIKNLIFEGDINSKNPYTSGVTAYVYGKLQNLVSRMNVTISTGSGCSAFGFIREGAVLEDVVNEGTITAPATYVGGISYQVESGVKMTRCGNKGIIKSTYAGTSTSSVQSIGGLVGYSYPAEYIDCYNIGTFEFTPLGAMYGVGGLIGTAQSSKDYPEGLRMTGCYNTADIDVSWLSGGLVASVNASTTVPNPLVFTNCYNTGDISSYAKASKSSTALGGLAGVYTPGSKFVNCYNTGDITQSAKVTYAAGIAAYYKNAGTEALPILFKNCYNTGAIKALGNQGGGIVAYMTAYTTVEDCYNTGNISGGFGLGGIAACVGTVTSKIIRSWNSGNIESNKNRAGGIFGYNTAKATVEDCFNVGNVEITIDPVKATNGNLTDGYGAGGIAGSTGALLNRCYNMGTIKGKCQVGGIVGQPYKNNARITNCYNAGTLDAPADTCGSIIGVSTVNNGRWWTDQNAVENCYYIGANLPQDLLGTAKTEAELAGMNLGEGWVSGEYTYPVLAALNNDLAKVWAARVILKAADAVNNVITGSFYVGLPAGLTWSTSIPDNLNLGANKIWWTEAAYTGEFTMTATCGDYSRTVTLNASKSSGVTDVDGRTVVSETYYTVSGLQIARPQERDGRIYIVVRVYDDGTRQTLRVRN